jgi:phenylacetate-CoA ligase
VAPGQVGEVVVTTLTPEYPLIRFATADLSALLAEPSPCGRTNQRIRGWLGRADQSAKVRGMFVHPSQIGEITRRHPAVRRARLVIERPASSDVTTLMIETSASDEAEAVAATVKAVTKLRAAVTRVAQDSLPQDGRLIEDRWPIG